MKISGLACGVLLLLSACSETSEPPYRPDAALIERLALANIAAPAPPEKLEKADKLVAAVARVEPDRVAGAAEKLLAR